jgi:thiamine pyrophosphokinase
MKALLLVNGELYKPDVLQRRIHDEAFDLAVGADGGARHARTLNVALDAVIGDLDSLPDLERRDIGNAEFVSYPAEKDESDLELGVLYARERGADHIVIVGALGGRMETAIANVLLMAHASLTSCRIEVWHGEQTGWVIRPPGGSISGRPGDTVSLIPISGDAVGITTKAMKYRLRNEGLHFGSSRGMSNVIKGASADVKLSKGLLLAVHTAGKGEERKTMTKKTVNVSVQVLPMVDDLYAVVDKAIEVIQASGLKYEVGPMETTMEGDNLDRLLDVAKAAHRACFEAGARKVVTIIKIGDAVEGMTMCGKVDKYRKCAP